MRAIGVLFYRPVLPAMPVIAPLPVFPQAVFFGLTRNSAMPIITATTTKMMTT